VAQATVLRRIEVPRVHASGRSAIVTGCAGAQDLGVINGSYRCPDICVVTIFADVGRLRVQWTLASCVGSVMTADTVIDNVCVIEIGRQPRDSRVAVITIIAAGDMRWVFANGYHTVMTRATSPNNLSVVNRECWNPGVRCMAIFADNTGKNMVGVLAGGIRAVVAARTIASDIDVIKVRR